MMDGSNCSKSSGGYLSISFGNSTSLSGSGEVMKYPPSNNRRSDLSYESLYNQAKPDGRVKLEQENQFFVITHPTKLNTFKWSSPYLGWKFHISVKPDQLEKAFNLVEPILTRLRLGFKVINLIEVGDAQGEQITIYPVEDGNLVVTAEVVGQMMERIHREFLLNGIEPGNLPASDAPMISSFFSMRCDICRPLLNRSLPPGYVPVRVSGTLFNPMNYPNPFDSLLKDKEKPFDPMVHLRSFNLGKNNENVFYRSLDTMKACINEYTHFETLSDEDRETFIIQYCLEKGKDNTKFFKDKYQHRPEILLAVKHAFTLVFMYETDTHISKNWYFMYINSSQFSKQYPFGNSFGNLLKVLEEYALKQIERFIFIQTEMAFSLIDLYLKAKGNQTNSITLFPKANISQLRSVIK
jgi:hypothetical protein